MTETQTRRPLRGDIYDVNLDPVIGAEIGKQRPALIISNNINNEYADTVTVLPITSQPSKREYPFEVNVQEGVAGLNRKSRVKANQIRTLDKHRLVRYRGHLPEEYLPLVERAIKIHLNLT